MIMDELKLLAKIYDNDSEKLQVKFNILIGKKLKYFNTKEIVSILKYIAKLGMSWDKLSETLKYKLMLLVNEKLELFGDKEIIDLLNSFAMLGVKGLTLDSLLKEALAIYNFDGYKDQEFTLMYVKSLSFIKYFNLSDIKYIIPSIREDMRGIHISKMQKNVANQLKDTFPELVVCEEVRCGPYMVDILINDRYIVEVNGPSHFDMSNNFKPYSLYKINLLEKMGYEVININHFDYSEKYFIERFGIIYKRNQKNKEFMISYRSSNNVAKKGIEDIIQNNSEVEASVNKSCLLPCWIKKMK